MFECSREFPTDNTVNRKRDLQQLCWDRDEKIRIVSVKNLCRKPGKGHEDLSTQKGMLPMDEREREGGRKPETAIS
jgi:hypothetical protein